MSRIVLFGATGYTGRLVAAELTAAGGRPVLAGRDAEALGRLAAELSGGSLATAVADVHRPESVRDLLEPGDVLVTTVGPFQRWGHAALQAAIERRATYLDSTGEPAFIRSVFEEHGPRAATAGVALLTAFGYDYVPGNAAAALVLDAAGPTARRVDVGYFTTGPFRPSGGTRASAAGAITHRGFAFRDGRLGSERAGRRVSVFQLPGGRREAISVPGTEHYALPRRYPQLTEVGVYLGWFGPRTRAVQALGHLLEALLAVPGGRMALEALATRARGSSGGPDEEMRERAGSCVVAVARDDAGQPLRTVTLTGVDPYSFTARFLAWAAVTAADPGVDGVGALGPVEAFGLVRLMQGVRQCGLDPLTGD